SGARRRRHRGAGPGPRDDEQCHVRSGWLDVLRDDRGRSGSEPGWTRTVGRARRHVEHPEHAGRGPGDGGCVAPSVRGVASEGRRGSTCLNEVPLAPKVSVSLAPGDVLRLETPGGGGWGKPERGDNG